MITLSLLLATAAATAELGSLDRLRWERRIILVFVTEARRAEALDAFNEAQESLVERDVTWLLLEEGKPTASNHESKISPALTKALFEGLAPVAAPLDVVLIGKDGGVKYRGPSLDLQALFDQIDGMPMRRRELREREGRDREGEP